MLIEILLIFAGFILLVKSADWFVDGSVVLARKLHIDAAVVGITLVALGTSLPEFFVNLSASQREMDDALVGNVLGSSVFNLLVILGLQTAICPLEGISKKWISFDLPLALLFALLFLGFALFPFNPAGGGENTIGRWEGIILSLLYLIFLAKQYYDYRFQGEQVITEHESVEEGGGLLVNWIKKYYYVFIVIGIVGLYFGSELTIDNSVNLARRLNLSEVFVGIFILSVGTSLPELVTSIMAIKKSHHHLALGNVLGSNICNIGIVLAFYSWWKPIAYNTKLNHTSIFLILVTGYLFLILILKKKKNISRGEGIAMVLAYLFYAVYSNLEL